MKQYFKQISVISGVFWSGLCIAQSNITGHGVSQPSDTSTIPLREVIITENRMQLPFAKQNRNIQIIDRKQIEALPARSINELLSHVSGVDIRQRGPFGTQADVSIDG